MKPAAARYFEEVDGLLRAKNIPAATADSLLADLKTQITTSASHPYTEFGDPEALADRLAVGSGSTVASVLDLPVVIAFGLAAVALVIDGLVGILQDHSPTFGIEPVFVVIIGMTFAALAAWPFLDRTHRLRYTGPWWTASAIVAAAMTIPAATQIVSRLF